MRHCGPVTGGQDEANRSYPSRPCNRLKRRAHPAGAVLRRRRGCVTVDMADPDRNANENEDAVNRAKAILAQTATFDLAATDYDCCHQRPRGRKQDLHLRIPRRRRHPMGSSIRNAEFPGRTGGSNPRRYRSSRWPSTKYSRSIKLVGTTLG